MLKMHRSFTSCIQANKESKEREQALQQQIRQLTIHIQRLERCMVLLRAENDVIRKKENDQKSMEDKIELLKKCNDDLASSASKLEEKVKLLRQENVREKSRLPILVARCEVNPEVDHIKRIVARQRAKDFAVYSKKIQTKDKEIEDLQLKCQRLADRLINGEIKVPQNVAQFEEKDEYVRIIKTAAKERLQMEFQVARSRTKEKTQEPHFVQGSFQNEVGATQEFRHKDTHKFEKADSTADRLEQQLTEKSKECQLLSQELSNAKQHKQNIEHELSIAVSKNHQLRYKVRDLHGQAYNLQGQVKDRQRQVQDFEKITEECITLKQSLTTAQKETDNTKEECATLKRSLAAAQREKDEAKEEAELLSHRVHSLENVVRDLQESAEHVGQLENDKKSALEQLQQKQAHIEELQKTNTRLQTEHRHTVDALSKLVVEMEDQIKKEEERRLLLVTEVQQLQKEARKQEGLLAELEQSKQELAKKHQDMFLTSAANVPLKTQAAISANMQFKDKEDNTKIIEEVIRKRIQRKSWNQNEQHQDESLLSAWVQNGPIQVYVAKYNYDPFELSPNENPEAELPLTAGDYVLVVGEVDEDGFFDGELIDGTQGLVPSNFIEKLEVDEDLMEFHEALLHAGQKEYTNIVHNSINLRKPTSATTTTPLIFSDMANINNNNSMELYVPSEETVHSKAEVPIAPCPQSLSLDTQLPNSLQITWKGPDSIPGVEIYAYHVLVDGQLKALVKSNERTKAILDGISPNDTTRICVRCSSSRGMSTDAQCTMLVGKDAYPVPSELKISYISQTSISLSWLPGNSNYQHSIVVNGAEVTVVKPGVFCYTLSGLASGTLYKVTLIAKYNSGILDKESSIQWVQNTSSSIKFYTPDSVNNIDYDEEDLKDLIPSQTSVKSGSTSSVGSVDITLVQHPQSMIKDIEEDLPPEPSDTDDQKSPGTDDEIEDAFKEYPNEGVDAVSESYSSSTCTELSDIPELEEDLMGSQDSRLNEIGTNLTNQIPALSQVQKTFPKLTTDTLRHNKVVSGSNMLNVEKLNQHGGKPLSVPAPLVPAAEVKQDSGTELAILTNEGKDSSPSKQNLQSDLSLKNQTHDTETSWQNNKNGENSNTLCKPNQIQHKNIVDSVQSIEMEGKISNKNNEPQSIHQDSRTHLTRRDLPEFRMQHNSRGDLISQKPKTKHKIIQRSLSDSDSTPEHTKNVAGLSSSHSHAMNDASDSDSISGQSNPVVKANSVRLFIALFDYNPQIMSPNVDSIDEELPFREGQILKVFGNIDADGFYKGENNGRRGYIPCNMVCEVQIEDPALLEQLLQDIAESPEQAQKALADGKSDCAQVIPNGAVFIPRKMIALYDYDPKELSPNVDAEVELSFRVGDLVMIYGEMDEDGFYTGEVNNKHGLVPSNFLQPAPSTESRSASLSTTRSCDSLEMALKSLERKDISNLGDPVSSSQQPLNANFPGSMPGGTRPNISNPANEDKSKKESFLSKSKNIFKKFAR